MMAGGTKRSFFSRLELFKLLVTSICSGLFMALSLKQFRVFRAEPVGSSLTRESMGGGGLPFPAITICDSHFQNALAFEELDLPRGEFHTTYIFAPMSPFGSPKEVSTNPGVFMEKLLLLNIDVVPNMWKYYFTLDDMFEKVFFEKGSIHSSDHRCNVGNVDCVLRLRSYEAALPDDLTRQEFEIEVEAGKWRSRFFASSIDAKIYLCHTLVPNMTVRFTSPGENAISLAWRKEYSKKSIHRRIYIHDKNEEVLLNAFAIETVPSVVVKRQEEFDDNFLLAHRKKLQIIPKLIKHPSPSDVLPCKNETGYSENWCNIQWGWHKKISTMRKYYGSNFTCVQPGVWGIPEEDPLPICAHHEASLSRNNSLGYYDIVQERSYANIDRPLMTAPSLGNYKSSSSCVRRCQLYTYAVLDETVSAYDLNAGASDVYMYFASPVVETWTEFRLMSMLDLVSGIGGNIGLFLGMSLLSIVLLIWDFWKKGIKYTVYNSSP